MIGSAAAGLDRSDVCGSGTGGDAGGESSVACFSSVVGTVGSRFDDVVVEMLGSSGIVVSTWGVLDDAVASAGSCLKYWVMSLMASSRGRPLSLNDSRSRMLPLLTPSCESVFCRSGKAENSRLRTLRTGIS